MSKQQFPNKILWLASYPKSGNTWFRAFLTALMNEGKVDINDLDTDGIFSSRQLFDAVADVDSRDLYDEEAKLMIADVYRSLACDGDKMRIVKVHDAFEADNEGNSIIPEDVTHGALYFIRNPLDIAGSLANHMHSSIQDAVNTMNNKAAKMAEQPGNLNRNPQFMQNLCDWSSHVDSWTLKPSFPVWVVRYEDMLEHTFETFQKAVNFIGWDYSAEQILKAAEACSFEASAGRRRRKALVRKQEKAQLFQVWTKKKLGKRTH